MPPELALLKDHDPFAVFQLLHLLDNVMSVSKTHNSAYLTNNYAVEIKR